MSFSKTTPRQKQIKFSTENKITLLLSRRTAPIVLIDPLELENALIITPMPIEPYDKELLDQLKIKLTVSETTSIARAMYILEIATQKCPVVLDRIDMMGESSGSKRRRAAIIRGALASIKLCHPLIITTAISEECVNDMADKIICV